MEKLLPNIQLYVGGDIDYDHLKGKLGWSFLRCAKYGPGGHKETLGYHTQAAPQGKNYLWVRKVNLMALNMLDLNDPHFIDPAMIEHGLDFIDERLKAGDKVLVACNAGHSRGPTTAMLYLHRIGELPHNFVSSENVYRALYPPFDPGQGMRQRARMMW